MKESLPQNSTEEEVKAEGGIEQNMSENIEESTPEEVTESVEQSPAERLQERTAEIQSEIQNELSKSEKLKQTFSAIGDFAKAIPTLPFGLGVDFIQRGIAKIKSNKEGVIHDDKDFTKSYNRAFVDHTNEDEMLARDKAVREGELARLKAMRDRGEDPYSSSHV